MKATGIVRRIDDLGRVVIPKEIRRTLRMREGDPLEIFVGREGEVILKKFSPMGDLSDFAQEYADSLYEATGRMALITDRDEVIAVSPHPRTPYLHKSLSEGLEHIMEQRKAVMRGTGSEPIADHRFTASVIAPIVSEGEPIGAVIIASKEPDAVMTNLELKLAETAAGFLAKQMEG
jgi:AbrB family transcriptional regulator (stage V sporulation protein T)